MYTLEHYFRWCPKKNNQMSKKKNSSAYTGVTLIIYFYSLIISNTPKLFKWDLYKVSNNAEKQNNV